MADLRVFSWAPVAHVLLAIKSAPTGNPDETVNETSRLTMGETTALQGRRPS
jgi:hypothetical protein